MIPRIEWNRLWEESGATGNGNAVFLEMVRAYGADRRHYHTLSHVMWVLKRIGQIMGQSHQVPDRFTYAPMPGAVDSQFMRWQFRQRFNRLRWAAWFHDAVMSGAPDDEKKSSDLAAKTLSRVGLQPISDEVAELVLSTAHETEPSGDAAILNDADIAILGTDPEYFDEYERQVREEWAHVTDADFAAGRAKILSRFLDKPHIYATEAGRVWWEEQARKNLERSIRQLGEVVA